MTVYVRVSMFSLCVCLSYLFQLLLPLLLLFLASAFSRTLLEFLLLFCSCSFSAFAFVFAGFAARRLLFCQLPFPLSRCVVCAEVCVCLCLKLSFAFLLAPSGVVLQLSLYTLNIFFRIYTIKLREFVQ